MQSSKGRWLDVFQREDGSCFVVEHLNQGAFLRTGSRQGLRLVTAHWAYDMPGGSRAGWCDDLPPAQRALLLAALGLADD